MEANKDLSPEHQDAQEYLEKYYPRNGTCLRKNEDLEFNNFGKKRSEITHLALHQKQLTYSLDLTDFFNLQYLSCSQNKIISLILKDNSNLKEIYCWENQLMNLILPTPNRLVKINVSNNFLTTFPYHVLNPLTLQDLRLWNNHFSATDIQVFSSLVNLEDLSIGNSDAWLKKYPHTSHFYGSLQALENHSQLTELYLYNTNTQTDLQYLPLSLQNIQCTGQMKKELDLYGSNLQLWQTYHPALMEKANKEIINLVSAKLITKKVFTSFSPQLIKWLKVELKIARLFDIFSNDGSNYSTFLLKDFHPFRWEKKFLENEIFSESNNFPELNFGENNSVQAKKQLPLRLYTLSTNQIIESKELPNNSNYLILSYCWGTDWEEQLTLTNPYPVKLTKEGRNALNKVIATWQLLKEKYHLNTDYIWIDNFCINQTDRTEKEQEVKQQRDYYSNAVATLIAIEETIGTKLKELAASDEYQFHLMIFRKIITSTWFSRSWTFQEGVLSKNTIFMFNDCLVDGRRLALWWGGNQGSYNPTSLTFITPLGWSYLNDYQKNDLSSLIEQSKDNFQKDDKSSFGFTENQAKQSSSPNSVKNVSLTAIEGEINLSLGQALGSITHRDQTVLLDSIYSILGLLPYGEKINVEYKEFTCACQNSFWTWWKGCQCNPYTKEDLESKISELINQACLYHPKEIITYLGERNLTNWWLPLISKDNSMSIEGSLNTDDRYAQYWLSQIQQITRQGIQLTGHYTRLVNGNQIVELDCNDVQGTGWPATLQFTLPFLPQPITIKQVEQWHYLEKNKRVNIFIDMINREIILESENPTLYYLQTSSFKTKLKLVKKNLTGILDLSEFINLEELHCYQNNLTSLILPNNEKLTIIYCGENQLAKLEVNNFPNLIHLGVNSNSLTGLDISNNHQLNWLNCANNQLSSLEFDHCLKLEYFDVSDNELTSLELSNNLGLETLFCHNNSLNNLDVNKNIKLIKLYCHYNNLEQINLTNNIKLKELYLNFNKLVFLDLTGLIELQIIETNDCYLTSFNYDALNPATLTYLNITDNNLPLTDIAVFSHLFNLETLWIGGQDKDKFEQNIYNRFYGSLVVWKDLTKLKSIEISNTDINAGVEFLPTSLIKINYFTKERPACRLTQIEQAITSWLKRKELIVSEQTNLLSSVEQS